MNELVKIVESKKNAVWKTKAAFMPKNINVDAYFQRALMSVMSSTRMIEIANNPVGAKSIFDKISLALQMGLQIGGQFPQATLMPTWNTEHKCFVVSLVISAVGYKYLATSDPAVVRDVEHFPIYEKEIESFRGDEFTGNMTIERIFSGDPGKIVGVWFVITKIDGTVRGKFVRENQIIKRMESSPSVKAVREKKIPENASPWITWYEEMFIQAAYKIVLSEYAKQKEGACLRLAVENDEEEALSKKDFNILTDKIIDIKPSKEEKENENDKKNNKNNGSEPLFD